MVGETLDQCLPPAPRADTSPTADHIDAAEKRWLQRERVEAPHAAAWLDAPEVNGVVVGHAGDSVMTGTKSESRDRDNRERVAKTDAETVVLTTGVRR